jgi:hypothetical protein
MSNRSAPRSGGGQVVVHLHEIPKSLRLTVAHELARYWKLTGLDYALFLVAAAQPELDPELKVPRDKAKQVLRGSRPGGTLPDDLKIRPIKLT